MSDNAQPGDDAHSTSNALQGAADNVIQARDIHGDVHVGNRGWWQPAAVVLTAVVVGAGIAIWPDSERNVSQAPSQLRVTADLSPNDMGPWGFVSESPDFPGAGLVERLARPMTRTDRTIPRDLRSTDAASLEHQVIRLHLEGPKDRAVTVTDIRPVIRTVKPSLNGSLVWAPLQGPELSTEVLLELDDPLPVLQSSVEDARGLHVPAGPFFPSHTIKLAAGETHEVVVTSSARDRSYEYELAVVYQSGADVEELIVNNAGRAFRVSGYACSGPHVASYRAAYVLRSGFSIEAVPDPQHLSVLPSC